MKVGILVWDLAISGGSQRQALELSRTLQNEGHDVSVYAAYFDPEECYPDLVKDLEIESLYTVKKGKENRLQRYIRPLNTLGKYPEYWQLCQKMDDDLDLVNCHHLETYHTAHLFKKRTGCPVVWMMNDPPNYFQSSGSKAKRVARDLLGEPVNRWLSKRAIASVDDIVVLDEQNQEEVNKNFDRNATIIRSGLNIEEFRYTPRDPLSKEKVDLLAVSIFFPHRRYEDLIRALSKVRDRNIDATLSIVGSREKSPEYAARIENLIQELDLESSVKLLGHVPEDELKSLYSSCDIFVFPNAPQTWGLAVFEAMASGAPVLITTGCGASEVLNHRENGMIVEPRAPEQLASSIEEVVANGDLYQELSENGRGFVEENITWNRYGAEMIELFKSRVECDEN